MTQFYDIQTWGPEIGPTSNFLFSTANFRIIAPSIAAAVWKVGGTVVMPGPAFAPETVLAAIEKHEITHLLLLPAQVHSVVAHPTFKNRHVDTVRSILTGSDVATRDLLFKISAAFPSAAVCAAHGMTEGGGFLQWTCFYDDAAGRWFKTGDSGMINSDGVIYILGRIKDVVMRAGIPITAAALESSIGQFTGASTAVVAIPSPSLGQEPFAVLQDFHGKSEAQVKQGVINLFGNDYRLLGAASLKQLGLNAFPLNATGKVMKVELQRVVEEYLDRQK
ncbi:hypothetical protein B0A55_13136 [Friedmanniomyces simplex]|uniref:AMP-dependent synthetase/ligase domain-containing protein n=1 Tax=Friedmanniomyces simplex TaxID=329884 RepID=A0A4U0WBW4_9PEZI|nr:hypothetical protein B0A55_13136 [Friedmanniomyces simplex]